MSKSSIKLTNACAYILIFKIKYFSEFFIHHTADNELHQPSFLLMYSFSIFQAEKKLFRKFGNDIFSEETKYLYFYSNM